MNTVAFVIAGILIGLVVLSKIPGLEHLVKPIIALVFGLLKVVSENVYSWAIWLFKALYASHADLFKNLIHNAEDIDPSQAMRKKEK